MGDREKSWAFSRLKVKTKTGRKERNTERDKKKKGKDEETEKAAEPHRETHTLSCGQRPVTQID